MHSLRVKMISVGLVLVVGGLLYAAGRPPSVWSQDPRCTLKTLKGTYIFALQGYQVQDNQSIPIANAGMETFDGKGAVEGRYTQSVNGEISRATYSGTYTITPECVVTYTITDSTGATSQFDEYVSPDGDELTFVQTDPGFVISGSERRVSK
jgi:hypothetical protein